MTFKGSELKILFGKMDVDKTDKGVVMWEYVFCYFQVPELYSPQSKCQAQVHDYAKTRIHTLVELKTQHEN